MAHYYLEPVINDEKMSDEQARFRSMMHSAQENYKKWKDAQAKVERLQRDNADLLAEIMSLREQLSTANV